MIHHLTSLCRLSTVWALLLGTMVVFADAAGETAKPRRTVATPLLVDRHLELARRYAPFVYHEIHPTKGRQDLPTRVDFDGDFRGDNNWENFERYSLPPTLYYAVVETESHWFVTYHIFHPRDWSWIRIGVHLTHENDGENLQVVVDKASGDVVLLFTQAHYWGRVHAPASTGFGSGSEPLRDTLVLVDDAGRPDNSGRHAAVYVEAYGHGIYALADSDVVLDDDGHATFENHGRIFYPARPGDVIREPDFAGSGPVPYQLASTTRILWPGLRDGTLVGQGGLIDGPFPYEDARVRIDVPGYYEANRFSGPFGPDRGISPFAVDFDFDDGTLGALFFDPAGRYAETLRVPPNWSRTYVNYPFGNKN